MIRLPWSDSGPAGEDNAYGELTIDGGPIICGHGGSMWLCRSCAEKIKKLEHFNVRPTTAEERERLKRG